MKTILATLLAATALVVSTQASAQTIVDTGAGFDANNGGYTLGYGQSLAGSFTLAQASTLTSIEGWIGGISGPIALNLTSDLNGLPGASIFSGSFDIGTPGWQGLDNLDLALSAGTYWVTFANASGLAWMPYNVSNPLQSYASNSGGGWHNGANGLGVKITGYETAAGVPEPAAWGMMIGGFGLAGAAMRRRRTQVSVRYATA